MCEVNGCGKCFARGEHLKRHVRSIHTNEKRKCKTRLSAFLVVTHNKSCVQLTSVPSLDAARTSAGTITLGSTCVFTRTGRQSNAAWQDPHERMMPHE